MDLLVLRFEKNAKKCKKTSGRGGTDQGSQQADGEGADGRVANKAQG